MAFDVHAHVTTDLPAQLARARRAGVTRTVLLSTHVHPEASADLTDLRAEFARLGSVLGGERSSFDGYRTATAELTAALAAHPTELAGFVNVPLGLTEQATGAWLADHLALPGIVGIGELSPTPGQAEAIEPVLAVSADHGGLPILVHGFAPHTAADLRTYATMAARFPQVPVIVGALGGLNWMDLVDLALEHRNLFVDLSSALQVFAVRMAVQALPAQCLFGSNTPYGDVLAARCTVEAAVPDPGLLDQVLTGNLTRLLAR
ncbi:amidohydrolase family protein [Kitasatospora sp. NBC_01250]|uniref:amidohydrolase family protein n=1 Tax=Kitasatospora sp. NBC_01250 TaxID=2903571 RepID=UPI002E330289|nr:amidohydrolase family protein [Kitasatospora sp. NBC_01250]